MNVSCNKNTVPGDKSALNPSGVRLGTPALTTRSCNCSFQSFVWFVCFCVFMFGLFVWDKSTLNPSGVRLGTPALYHKVSQLNLIFGNCFLDLLIVVVSYRNAAFIGDSKKPRWTGWLH